MPTEKTWGNLGAMAAKKKQPALPPEWLGKKDADILAEVRKWREQQAKEEAKSSKRYEQALDSVFNSFPANEWLPLEFTWALAVTRMKVQPERFNQERDRLLRAMRTSKRFEVARGTGKGVRRLKK